MNSTQTSCLGDSSAGSGYLSVHLMCLTNLETHLVLSLLLVTDGTIRIDTGDTMQSFRSRVAEASEPFL